MKKFLVFFLSFQLVFFSPFANAFDFEKYKKNSNVKAGSKSAFGYSVMSSADGKPYLWSGLKRQATPTSLSKLYKVLGPTAAFSAAVFGILGAVDWVMDPDNNQIKYNEPVDPDSDGSIIYRIEYASKFAPFSPNDFFLESTTKPDVPAFIQQGHDAIVRIRSNVDEVRATYPDTGGFPSREWCLTSANYTQGRGTETQPVTYELVYTNSSGNTSIDYDGNHSIRYYCMTTGQPPADTVEKTLPFEVIAAEVIEDADAGDAAAEDDANTANDPETWARRGLSDPNGDPEPELKANEKPAPCHVRNDTDKDSCFKIGGLPEPDENPNKPDDTNDPEPAAKVELPAFCDWAVPACNFFVNSLNQSRAFFATATKYFTSIETEIKEAKTPLESDTQFTEPEVTEPEPPLDLPVVESISFSTPSACPANPKINFSLGRVAASIDIPVHLVCYVAELIRPFVIAGGYLTGASILFRGRES